MDWVTDCY